MDENEDEKEDENEEEFNHLNGDIIFDGDPAGARGVSGPSPQVNSSADMLFGVLFLY